MNELPTRELRVFISSTFLDMKEEREMLMTKVFPMLIQKAKSRRVTLIPMDYRWGILTNNVFTEKNEVRIVDVCLREIEKAQCFIGIIGNRYGWCPSSKVLNQSSVLSHQHVDFINPGMSLTEIEMRYGIINCTEQGNAFFFIKEKTPNTEIEMSVQKFRNKILKEKDNGNYEIHNYSTLESLSQQVEIAVNKVLDNLFPDVKLDDFQLEDINQQYILKSYTKNYIPPKKLIKKIDDEFKKNQFVIVTGDVGMGKSSLIANWIERQRYDDVIFFFINNSDIICESRVRNFLCRKISEKYGIEFDDKQPKDNLKELLKTVCNNLRNDRHLILAFDGLSNAQIIIHQLLPVLPEKIKVLFSAYKGDENYMWSQYFKCSTIVVKNLDWKQRERFIKLYLDKYKKSLNEISINYLSQTFVGGPLHLRILLDILITFGNFDTINSLILCFSQTHPVYKRRERNEIGISLRAMKELISDEIQDYMKYGRAESRIKRFYNELLNLYETQYPELPVKEIISAFTFISEGIKENEIVNFVNTTPLKWGLFKSFFESFLYQKDGFLFLNNQDLKSAAIERYGDIAIDIFNRGAFFFDENDGTLRCYMARLSHDSYVGDISSLVKTMYDISLFRSMHHHAPLLLSKYWDMAIIEAPDECYLYEYADYLTTDGIVKNITKDLEDEINLQHEVARFCIDYMCNGEAALHLLEHAFSSCEKLNGLSHPQSLEILRTKAEALILIEDYESAVETLDFIITEYENRGDIVPLAESYRLRGEAFAKIGKMKHAFDDAFSAIDIFIEKKVEENNTFMKCLLSIGRHFIIDENYTCAMDAFERAYSISMVFYGRASLSTAMILENMALFYFEMEQHEDALVLITNSIEIYNSIMHEGNVHLARPHYIKGLLLLDNDPYQTALEEFKKSYTILTNNNIRNQLYFNVMKILVHLEVNHLNLLDMD